MLPHYKIVNGISRKKIRKPTEMLWIIFGFKPYENINIIFVFISQSEKRVYISVKLFRTHTEVRIVVAVKKIRAVVRKAERFYSLLYCFFNIFPVLPHSMMATERMSVKVCQKYVIFWIFISRDHFSASVFAFFCCFIAFCQQRWHIAT